MTHSSMLRGPASARLYLMSWFGFFWFYCLAFVVSILESPLTFAFGALGLVAGASLWM
ncbi:MAG: hypothetical protein ABR498_04040 [Candidatus Dormibacteria bacterium]